jgi:protein-disulfide isomerase
VLLLAILLAACTFPQPELSEPTFSAETGALLSAESDGGERPAEKARAITPVSRTGSLLPERLLPSGVLEIGDRDAPHAMLLITEHQCRYCRDFLTELLPQIRTAFLEPGSLRLSIAILPLRKYPGSEEGAAGLLCAAQQGKGLPMHWLLSDRTSRDRGSLLSFARELALDPELFGACLSAESTTRTLESQQAWLRSLDVTLVPTYFIDGVRSTGLPYAADLLGQLREATE